MLRKIGWGLLILYNFFRMPLSWLLAFGRIKYALIEIISPAALLAVSNKGLIEIGQKCGIDGGTLIRASGGKIRIGDRVYINRNCNVVSKDTITIGEYTTLGPNVAVYDHDHSFGNKEASKYRTAPIFIGKNVWIGTGAIILKGVTIGDNCVIGAGTIITKNIPANTIATTKNEILMREIK